MPLFKHIKCLNVGLHVGEFVKEALKFIIVCLSKKNVSADQFRHLF